MPIRPILRLGDPVLRTRAAPLLPQLLADAEIQQLIDDMAETMDDANGVGLAAPQIGVSLQIFVYRPSDEDDSPLRVLVNPMVEPQPGELIYDWEGCLSIPELRGLVPRHPAVRVHALDRDGGHVDYIARDFEARIIQHEFDHLSGVIYLDRMRDLRSLAYESEWSRYLAHSAAGDDEQAAVG